MSSNNWLFNGFTGSRSEFDSRFSSVQFINVSLWDFVPVEIRNKLSQLKESNQQVRDLIDYLIGCNVTTVSETAIQISENIGKSALCQSILLSVDRAKSMLESISSDETLSEIELNRKKSGSLLCTSQACHSLNILHRCIINVEMHGKLTPNIKQLLIKLLSDVERCDNSAEKIDIAVNNFFANLDLALKKTLSILEEYQKKYEEMKERYNVISSELNDARESDYKSKAMIANLCSHLEAEVKKRTQLENYLEQSNEKNRILENDIKDQKLEIDEMQISLNVKKSLIANAKNYIEEWEKSFDEINQKRRDTNHENEELKRLLSGKERELIQLEAKCYTAINETTKKEREMRYLEGKFIRSKVIIKILRRKYEKRENFLIEMESILKATKIKLDCTREIKRMLQEMVDRLKRFLAEHGCNIDEIAQLRNSDPILSSSAFGPINLSTVDSFKVETLYCKLSKKSKKIENLEQRLEQSKENFYIPDWRKESDDEIKIDDEDLGITSFSTFSTVRHYDCREAYGVFHRFRGSSWSSLTACRSSFEKLDYTTLFDFTFNEQPIAYLATPYSQYSQGRGLVLTLLKPSHYKLLEFYSLVFTG
ncbi:unnamed protein product [Dracunculus medinensis]|uniref:Coiled-coil domain-containing protein n=1 Tax=Dracunculus medinensis TaxID=318479 RepID=A0A0N4UDP3_DRAME|nr:unnamed protein product [Dracunculus medinensis]